MTMITLSEPLIDITQAFAGLTVFPNSSDVFVEPVARYRKHLHALISINLQLINSNWLGTAHLLNRIEHYDGYLGDDTARAHSNYCKANWLSCALDQNSRYTLLADFDFFALDSVNAQERFPDYQQQLAEQYEAAEKNHHGSQSRYQRFGGLYAGKRFKPDEKDDANSEPNPLLNQLGGKAQDGNWTVNSSVEVVEDLIRGVVPRLMGIDDFHFIASASGFYYRKHSADEILLFYSPSTRIAMHTFDWT